jgi:hypothetical protein
VKEPDEDEKLDEPVEGDELNQEASGHLLDKAEHPEDHPVGQPLLVILLTCSRLYRIEAHEARVGHPDEICH